MELVVPALAHLDGYVDALETAAGRRATYGSRRQRASTWSGSPRARRTFWRGLTTARPGAATSPCPTDRRWLVCRASCAGCGMVNSAARSVFAGNAARRPCHRIAWATSATVSCRGIRSDGLCDPCLGDDASRGPPRGLDLRRTHDRPGQSSLAERAIAANGGVFVERFTGSCLRRQGRTALADFRFSHTVVLRSEGPGAGAPQYSRRNAGSCWRACECADSG